MTELGGQSLSSFAPHPLAVALVGVLARDGRSLAVAESLTGGALASAIVAVPGASAVMRGGVVAYATDVKQRLLGVSEELLDERGAVDPDVALSMAEGALARLGSTIAVATTGVAGPVEQDGKPVGRVYIAVVGEGGSVVREFNLSGDRGEIRMASVAAALQLAGEFVASLD